jgi:hypothetical protein
VADVAPTAPKLSGAQAFFLQNGVSAAKSLTDQNVLALKHMQGNMASFDLKPLSGGDLDVSSSWDTRSISSPALTQTLARADTPGLIGRQMAEALQRLPDKPVELSLNPQELGRVKMSISASEAGITVSVLAERPETLDLMRRHIDQLTREFQSIGYQNISFAFAEGQAHQNPDKNNSEKPNHKSGQSETVVEGAEVPNVVKLGVTTGLDVRL